MRKYKPPVLRQEEEEEILLNIIEKVKNGQPVLRSEVIDKVIKFIRSDRRKNPFKNGSPGDKWFCLFRRRHNDYFTELEPAQLRSLENIGFTEKPLITNTPQYTKKPNLVVQRDDNTPVKRNPVGRPRLHKTPTVVQTPVQILKHPPPSLVGDEGSCDSTMESESGVSKDQNSRSEYPDFKLGSRLEVMDFNEKWYPVKVVEVDYEEGEVLVHFEKWSDRYDEWVRMDSKRIRQPILPPTSGSKKVFEKDEKVIAVWAYNHKYPATVKEVLPNDKYEVLFSDGYAKILRGCKLHKATEEDLKNCPLPPPKKPAPPMGADPLDPDLGPKEERRLKKRRMDVLEALRPHKRQKTDGNHSTPESVPRPSNSTVIRSTSKVTPATSRVTFSTSKVTPATSRVTFSTSKVTPSTSPDTPSTSTVKPSTSTVTPATSKVTPSTSPDTPSTSPDTPSTSPDTPSTSTVKPSTSKVTPSTSPVTPSTSTVKPYASTFTPSLSLKSKETPKIVLRGRGRPPSKHKEMMAEARKRKDDEEDSGGESTAADTPQPEPEVKLKRRRKKKKLFDESTYFYRGPKQRAGLEEDPERWNVEIPEGASPVQIKDHAGYYRESVIIPDKKMPAGWTKHTMRRKSGAKWDVFLVNPQGRKFRSRNELRNYFAELNQPFPDESFDFMVGRKLEMIRTQGDGKRRLDSSMADGDRQGQKDKKAVEATPDSRRIKTLLPKGRLLEGEEGRVDKSPGGSPATPITTTPPFSLKELRTPDGGFTCCGKNFRKENLFQMHMKHYHPEYSTLFGSTPNVADLAYARTVGEPLEDSRAEVMTPRNTLMERVTRYEAERKASETAAVSPGSKSLPEKELTPNTPLVTEPPAIPPAVEKTTDKHTAASIVEEVVAEKPTACEEPKEGKVMKEVIKEVTAPSVVNEEPTIPPIEDKKSEPLSEAKADSVTSASKEAPPVPAPASPSSITATSSIPTIRPVPKQTTEAPKATVPSEPAAHSPPVLIYKTPSTPVQKTPSTPAQKTPSTPAQKTPSTPVQKTASTPAQKTPSTPAQKTPSTSAQKTPSSLSKVPITITKYVPPGQKPASSSLTKLTISMTTPYPDKDVKPTIKTLLPMRPPNQEARETQESPKPKEIKSKEESEDETTNKSKPRKRIFSETFPKKPKLLKPTTGSLEEEVAPGTGEEVQPSHTGANPCYRFSRNRSQVPRVSLEKLNITPDSNGRIVLANGSTEDKITNATGESAVSSEPPPGGDMSAQDTVYENLRKEEIINCTCGYMEEDGLMIQCDLCLCWQHGLCNNIDKESDVPEKYVCYTCQHPLRERPSMRYLHNQDWLKEGKLPSLSIHQKNKDTVVQRETMLKKSHDLVASLLDLQTVIRSLRVKTHIAMKPDHPKLYLWAKSWRNENSDVKTGSEEDNSKQGVTGPQPEAAIDETECRLQLLDHIEDYQHQADDRLTSIQAQIAALESEDPDLASDESTDRYPATKQTVQMILHDLQTVRRVAALN